MESIHFDTFSRLLSCRKAYERISEGISEFEEDHLDLDLVEEGEYLERYLAMLRK